MTTTSTNTVTQLPGKLNIDMTDDNDLVFSLDWNMDITDYTFEASIIPENCEAEIPMVVDIINASEGKMNLVILQSSIIDISPSVNRWYCNWTTPAPDSYIRTVLAGNLVLRSK